MKLQLALDRLTQEQCFQIVGETADAIDWIELGTGVIKQYGMEIVYRMKQAYPEKVIVADMKTCDAGSHEALQAFSAGADITTVMAFSADRTIVEALETASRHNAKVMVDLLNTRNEATITRLERLGVELVLFHHGKDMQSDPALARGADFESIGAVVHAELAVAGGIDANSLPTVLGLQPDIVIIGSAITQADSPSAAASTMKEVMNRHEANRERHS